MSGSTRVAAASPTTSRSELRSTTSRACVPIDPVEPRMITRRTHQSLGAPRPPPGRLERDRRTEVGLAVAGSRPPPSPPAHTASRASTGRPARPGYDPRVRFGIFYEHQLPRPWEDGAEHRLLKDALEQVEIADRVGFDYVWEVEHHFLEEYSHSSAPEVFLAAASQRTKRIRLGHGIVQIPPQVNHPARVAERIATLDLICDGRLEFGTGESSSAAELGGFLRGPRAEARDVGRRPRRDHPHVRGGAVRRLELRALPHAAPQRGSEAVSEAAPAAVGGVQPARDDPPRRPQGHRGAVVLVRRARGRGQVGEGVLRADRVGRVRAGRLRCQPERDRRAADDVPRGRGAGDPARRRRRQLLRLLARPLLRRLAASPPA